MHSARHRRVIYLGVRSVREQLAPHRGLDAAWIRAYAAVLRHAQAARREAALDAPGEPAWQPTLPEHRADHAPGEFIELRIEGNNSVAPPDLALGFEDDVLEAAGRR